MTVYSELNSFKSVLVKINIDAFNQNLKAYEAENLQKIKAIRLQLKIYWLLLKKKVYCMYKVLLLMVNS